MRITVVLLALMMAILTVVQANDCIMTKCAYQLDTCVKDMSCSESLECSVGCDPFDSTCVQRCANEVSCNSAFKNMTSCAAQCLIDAPTQVLELIAAEEHEMRIMSKCNIIKKAECAVGVAAAISTCGGPENIPCVISRLKMLHGCGKCFCQSLKCRGLCKDFC